MTCLAVGPLFVACGGGDDGESTGTSVGGVTARPQDACGLLSTGEVEAGIGAAVQEGESASSPTATLNTCFWASQGASLSAPTLTVSIGPAGQEQYEALKGATEDPKEIAGLGDEAFVDPTGGVALYDGDTFLTVTVADGTEVDIEATKLVAEQILGKLAADGA